MTTDINHDNHKILTHKKSSQFPFGHPNLDKGETLQTEESARQWTTPISEALCLRLYADSKPHNQLTFNLQKGLILVSNGVELVGEGIGLGVPAVSYKNRTYFPGLSTMTFKRTHDSLAATKEFTLNLTSERTFRNAHIETKAIRRIRRRFDEFYRNHKHVRLIMFESLLRQVGVRTEFVQTEPIGKATVTYTINAPNVKVKAKFNLAQKVGVRKIYLLNEQSSLHFGKYYDSDGLELLNENIGAWETVNAHWACIYSTEDKVGFRLCKLRDATLHRGREFLNGVFDWAGLDYETGPEKQILEYNIELLEG